MISDDDLRQPLPFKEVPSIAAGDIGSLLDPGSPREALDSAFDRLVHIVENAKGTRRFLVTRMIEVEAIDEAQAVQLAKYGEGIEYAAQVESIP